MNRVSTDARRREQGFSLVFVVMTLIFLQSTLFSAVETRTSTNDQDQRNDQAYDLIQRLTMIPFGTASGVQLSELFDDDQDLGTATLKNLEHAPGTAGHSFQTSQAGVTTDWRITVTNDLDGDGATTGFREGRQDLLLVEVHANGRLMFRTTRAADFPNTRRD